MATIRDVSKLAGVSVATVSRVINKKGYVSKETEESIINAMEMLNYTPNDVARRLAGKKSNTIGLIIPDILNPFFPEVARAAEDTANKLGFNLILCNSDDDREKENQYYEMLINKQVDGIIIASYTATPTDLISLMNKNIPVIALDREYKGFDIPFIKTDDQLGGELATNHLVECGCKNIAHITGPLYIDSFKERLDGFENILKKNDLYNPQLIRVDELSLVGGYEATKKLLEDGKEIDGIFAGNDILAIGCYKALNDLGYNLYDDIKLIGYDGLEANVDYLEISSISQPTYDLGKYAVDLLVKEIREEKDISKEKIKLDLKIKKRKSTLGK
ncbi:MAG TPA: LacI family transcriptional regulator [Candidatus Atopostipes pullistercoris]|uniref:LacI family transcriptional regulator n=1 Tax=Candidatus Atopostipes pullistercoris TaxID=2838467 RepID=A0A9D2G167_9LACT|nr:LacI family transcriptional regulator [Candidatus Atopostipes pullistercoris]